MKFTLLSLFLLTIHCVFAQNNSEIYYNQFDTLVNSYGSDLNTGQRFEDVFLTTSDNEFRFFMTKESVVGQLNYNTQVYYQCSLKYDLLDDNLLFKNVNGSNPYDVILDKSMVDSFSFLGRDFVRLPEKVSSFSFYNNGFFEIIAQEKDFNVFVKHEKFKKKKLGDKTIYYIYSQKETILLEYKLEFFQIKSKNDIIKILPDRKDDIKIFYKINENLESQNKIEFMKNLFATLSTTN